MRTMILKLILLLLAVLGIHLPGPTVYVCIPGHTPTGAPSNCETIRL